MGQSEIRGQNFELFKTLVPNFRPKKFAFNSQQGRNAFRILSDSDAFVTLSGIPELVSQLRIDSESVTNFANTYQSRYEIGKNYLRIHSHTHWRLSPPISPNFGVLIFVLSQQLFCFSLNLLIRQVVLQPVCCFNYHVVTY